MSYGAIIVVRNSSRKVIDIITFKKRRQGSQILAGINRHFATVHLSNEGMKCGTAVLQGINENCYVLSKQNRPAINPDFDPDRSCLFDVFQSQALCPGGITAVSPGPNSSSAPSSMTTLILPETIYTEYVVLDNYLFFDRFHAFLPAPAWFQYGSTNRYITEICKFNLSILINCTMLQRPPCNHYCCCRSK